MTSIILSHFILDLRSIYQADEQSSSSSKQSTINFASVVEGNLGASLNTSWTTGREGTEVNEEDVIQYSKYPLYTGLVNTWTVDNAQETPDIR